MVKGKRGCALTKGSVRTRSTALSMEEESLKDSPPRKETRMEKLGGKLTHNVGNTRTRVRSYKTSMCITSFFYADVTKLQEMEAHVVKVRYNSTHDQETFKNDRNTGISFTEDIVTDSELFKTDETPVAVPVRGPSTPHRINLPNASIEESDVRTASNTIVERNKSLSNALITVQPLATKKPGIRGRRKVNSNQRIDEQSINSTTTKSTDHKLTDYYPVRRSVRKCKKAVLEEKQRDLENKVLCQVEEGLKVKHFVGKGRGIVTTREFFKGEFVVEYIGELIDLTTAKKRETEYAQDQNTGCYMYYFQHRNQQYCVDATAETNKLGRLVNHCRNGNLVARVVEVDSVPHLVLTAKEDIPIGVEVTYDYGDRSREAIRNHPWLAL